MKGCKGVRLTQNVKDVPCRQYIMRNMARVLNPKLWKIPNRLEAYNSLTRNTLRRECTALNGDSYIEISKMSVILKHFWKEDTEKNTNIQRIYMELF